jgi:hypothetical protein
LIIEKFISTPGLVQRGGEAYAAPPLSFILIVSPMFWIKKITEPCLRVPEQVAQDRFLSQSRPTVAFAHWPSPFSLCIMRIGQKDRLLDEARWVRLL